MFVLQFFAGKFPLVIKQPLLAPQSAAVTAQRAISANNAMTWDSDANHVGAVGTTNGSTRVFISELLRHPRIRTRLAHRNRTQNPPSPQLKVRPDWRQRNVELQLPARKIIGKLRTKRLQMWMFTRHDICAQLI